jgi:hypothetical protein
MRPCSLHTVLVGHTEYLVSNVDHLWSESGRNELGASHVSLPSDHILHKNSRTTKGCRLIVPIARNHDPKIVGKL